MSYPFEVQQIGVVATMPRHIIARCDGREFDPPGSLSAISKGCVCDPDRNNRGQQSPWQGGGWWVSVECKMHLLRRM